MKSRYINPHKAILFYEASIRALDNRLGWNCFITIHLESVGIPPKEASEYVCYHMQLLKKYHQRHGMPYSYGWVLENGPVKGVHVHILMHRPINMPMHAIKYRWDVLKLYKLPNKKGVMKIKKISIWGGYENNLKEVLAYVLKGIKPESSYKLKDVFPSFTRTPSEEGVIYGKRIGWSRCRKSEK